MIYKYLSLLKKEKDIVLNTFFISYTGILSGIVSMFVNVFFSRFFGPANFGLYKTALSLASTGAYIMDLGMKYLLPRYIAEFEGKNEQYKIGHLIQKTLAFKGMATVVVLLVSWLVSHQISSTFFHSPDNVYLIWPTMFLFATISLDISVPVLFGFQNYKLIALSSILIPTSHLILGIPLALKFGLGGALVAAALAFILGSIPAIKFILKRATKNSIKKNFSYRSIFVGYSIPAYFANIPTYVAFIIIPVLSLFFTPRQIGFYGLSLSFFTAAQMVPVGLSNVMFPKVAQLKARGKPNEARSIFLNLLALYTPLVILGSVLIIPLSHPLLSLILPSFLPAVTQVIVQTIAALIFGYFSITVSYVLAIGKLRIATAINWIISIIFVILAFFVTSLAS